MRPVWAEINLKNIVHNLGEVRRLVGSGVRVMAVVKANAYGHGAVEVSRELDKAGADSFGVAIMAEAEELRRAGLTKPILVLGWTSEDDFLRALREEITLTIFCLEEAEKLSRISVKEKKKAVVHLKLDTGMGRLGWRPGEESLQEIMRVLELPGLDVEGIFTHLAKADEANKTYTAQQIAEFREYVAKIEEKAGFHFRLKHAANSAAVIDYPEAYFDLVRPGIMLYGLRPSSEMDLKRVDLREAFSLRARIAHVKEVPAQTAISYGGTYVTAEKSIIASLPLGYADGYSRLLSGQTEVICGGQRVPIVGRICMDQMMLNITAVKGRVKKGETVTLIGEEGNNFISVDELARVLGTINYEIVCMISGRVPRVYQR